MICLLEGTGELLLCLDCPPGEGSGSWGWNKKWRSGGSRVEQGVWKLAQLWVLKVKVYEYAGGCMTQYAKRPYPPEFRIGIPDSLL